MFGKIITPWLKEVAASFGHGLATGRSAQTAVAIARYRLANSKLPKKLSDLVPAYMEKIPIDPFSGQDIIYRLDNESYTVYSVGDDQKDDKGFVESKDKIKNKDWGMKLFGLSLDK